VALIVETGVTLGGVAGAESYVTVAEADTYWLNRNNATWAAALNPAKEAALREAAQYLDNSYQWLGNRLSPLQPMHWPRSAYQGNDSEYIAAFSIPFELKQAQCELALEALSGRLLATLDRGGLTKMEKVGDLEVMYLDNAPGTKKYPFISLLLKNISRGSPGSVFGDAARG
jgi:hypothetical protein